MRATTAARRLLVVLSAAVAVAAGGCAGSGDEGDGAARTGATNTEVVSGPEAGAALDMVEEDKLTACIAVPTIPFAFEADGALDGIDIELVRALAGRLALQPNFKDVDPAGIFRALEAGECDIVASAVTITDELRKDVDFSEVYFRVNQSLLVRKGDESRYKDLASLKGRTIGVRAGTPGARFAREEADGATVEEMGTPEELFAALKEGDVDAVLDDFPVNVHSARTTGETAVTQTFGDGPEKEYGLAMRKGSVDLKRALDGALTQVKSDDTYPTILRRFLGDTAGQI